jgi:uncharacterized damage-inducible protein DinB
MNWTELLTSKIDETYAVTDNLMAMLEDGDLGWKPPTGDNWMTAGQLLMHLTNACGMCCKGFATGDWGLPEGVSFEDMPKEEMMQSAEKLPAVESVAQAREALAEDKKTALAMVAQAGEDILDTQKSEAPWNKDVSRSLGNHMLEMVNHLGIHKAQLFYYLKLMGKPVDTMSLWGV